MKPFFLLLFFTLIVFSPKAARAQQKDRNGKPIDFAQASTDHLTKVLNLDGFQSAAVKSFLDDYKKEVEAIGQVEMPVEARNEKYNIANQKLESKIKDVLNSTQKVLYEDEKNKKDKKKKKGKGKDTADEDKKEVPDGQ